MTNETALTTMSSSAIAAYGQRDDVREIADRLMALHPAAGEVGLPGMRAAAQLAIMLGANPLPAAGEIYVWKDFRSKMPVVTLGIAYYRRKASEKDSVIWVEDPRAMTDEEREAYGVSETSLAAICTGVLLSEYERLLKLGVPWQDAQKMLSRSGTAVVDHNEMYYTKATSYNAIGDPRSAPSARTWQWVANKRAEIDFYRVKSLVDTTLTDNLSERVMAQVGGAREIPQHIQEKSMAELSADLFDDDAIEGSYEPTEAQPEGETAVTEPQPTNDKLRKAFHATGTSLYGYRWDDKRAELCLALDAESSKDLTEDQTKKLLDGMAKKLVRIQEDETALLEHVIGLTDDEDRASQLVTGYLSSELDFAELIKEATSEA